MSKMVLQRILLVAGVIALVVVLIDGAISIAATVPGTTPVRIDHVTAGPYPLTVSLYTYPANAGYALPFKIAPTRPVSGSLSYHVESFPGQSVDANPVRATFSADPTVHNGVRGAAEITVKGPWTLQIQVDGPAGQGSANVPVVATALPPIPVWLGWLIGYIPLYVLSVFVWMLMTRREDVARAKTEQGRDSEVKRDMLAV